MPWGVAAAVVGGYLSNKAADKGADAQTNAANDANALAREQYNQDRADRKPWMDAGANALAQIGRLNSGDFSSFYASPDYQFNVDQQMKGLDRSAGARGSLFSGGTDVDRMKMMSGLASQEYGRFYSRLSDLANGGNSTAASLGSAGASYAQNAGNNLISAGNARASSYATQGQNNMQLAGVLGGAASYQWGKR